MALKNKSTTINYVRLREHTIDEGSLKDDGKKRYGFFVGKDETQPYSELEGKITRIFYKDEEFDGNPLRKLAVVLKDEDGELYQLAFNVETQTYGDFVKYLASLKNPFDTISIFPRIDFTKVNGKDIVKRNILISQYGEFAKAYFTKDNPNGLPKWHSAKVGNKVVVDKSDYLEFLENFVKDRFISKLPKEEVIIDTPSKADVVDLEDDDLPF